MAHGCAPCRGYHKDLDISSLLATTCAEQTPEWRRWWWAWGTMRLICPNCDAQYEVDESVIPDAGRDVQCSACGHTWFQPGPAGLAETFAEEPYEDLPDTADWEAGSAAADVWPEPLAAANIAAAQHTPHAPDAPTTPIADPATEDDDETGAIEPDATRRMLDENLLAILREEAEREARARRAEGRGIETQPELGLAPIPAALAARAAAIAIPAELAAAPERGARLRPDPADTQPPESPRRDRLPDIEVINSTLRATSERGSAPASRDAPETRARHRSGFRAGFVTVLLLAAVAAGAYVVAPRVAATIPALEPALTRYVSTVDAGRIWLDQRMRAIIVRLQADN